MTHLLDPAAANLTEWLATQGQPGYRAAQIRRWLFAGRVPSFTEMSDLPAALREKLAADYQLWTTTVPLHKQTGDGTEKLLIGLADGEQIECVLLRDGTRRTICISTPGRLRHGLRLLRQRPGRRRAQSHQPAKSSNRCSASIGYCLPRNDSAISS